MWFQISSSSITWEQIRNADSQAPPQTYRVSNSDPTYSVTNPASAGVRAQSLQSCSTLCNPMDLSPPGSTVHGILQVRILEGVAVPSSQGSSRPRDWTHVSYVFPIAGRLLTCWATWEARILTSPSGIWTQMLGNHSNTPSDWDHMYWLPEWLPLRNRAAGLPLI